MARDGVGNLIQIHEFVDEHQHTLVAAADQKARNELNVVVPVVIADDGRGAQLGACLALGAVFAANPFGHAAHGLFVAPGCGHAIAAEHAGEVEAVDHLLERGQLGIDDRLVDVGTRGDPAIQNKVERTALGARLGRYIADELAVGGKALSLTALQAALGRQVGISDDESLAHGVRADSLEQKALAGAVTTDQKAEARATVGDETQIGEQGADLDLAPYGDVRKADARDHAALERVENDGSDALGHARCCGCGITHGLGILSRLLRSPR